jgi:hypothetical protein
MRGEVSGWEYRSTKGAAVFLGTVILVCGQRPETRLEEIHRLNVPRSGTGRIEGQARDVMQTRHI